MTPFVTAHNFHQHEIDYHSTRIRDGVATSSRRPRRGPRPVPQAHRGSWRLWHFPRLAG